MVFPPRIVVILLLSSFIGFVSADNTVFTHVNVVPMSSETVLKNQIVIVTNNVISAIGNANELKIPEKAIIIDAKNAYMIPGLTDMHTHLSMFYLSNEDPAHVLLYPAFGVTKIRSLGGSVSDKQIKHSVDSGDIIGPDIILSAPVIAGNYGDDFGFEKPAKLLHLILLFAPFVLLVLIFIIFKFVNRNITRKDVSRKIILAKGVTGIAVSVILGFVLSSPNIIPFNYVLEPLFGIDYGFVTETKEQLTKEVQRQKSEGYSFVKPYDGLTQEHYIMLNKEATRFGMYSAGHAPDQIPLDVIVSSGQDEIVHIDELLTYHWKGFNLGITPNPKPSENNFKYPLDYNKIPETVRLLKENNISIVANIVLSEIAYRFIIDAKKENEKPEYDLIRGSVKNDWVTSSKWVKGIFKTQGEYRKNKVQPFLKELLKQLNKAGIIITSGTDTSVEGVIPGFHIHRELEILVESGFTPYEALKTSTVNAAKVIGNMGLDNNFGTIEVGKEANFILLTKNPLIKISHTRERKGIMLKGKWYSQTELDAMVKELIGNY